MTLRSNEIKCSLAFCDCLWKGGRECAVLWRHKNVFLLLFSTRRPGICCNAIQRNEPKRKNPRSRSHSTHVPVPVPLTFPLPFHSRSRSRSRSLSLLKLTQYALQCHSKKEPLFPFPLLLSSRSRSRFIFCAEIIFMPAKFSEVASEKGTTTLWRVGLYLRPWIKI